MEEDGAPPSAQRAAEVKVENNDEIVQAIASPEGLPPGAEAGQPYRVVVLGARRVVAPAEVRIGWVAFQLGKRPGNPVWAKKTADESKVADRGGAVSLSFSVD